MKQSMIGDQLRRKESFKRLINLSLAGITLLIEVSLFAYFWFETYRESIVRELHFFTRGNAMQIAFYAALLFFFSTMYGGMRMGYLRNVEVIFSQVFATFGANVLIYGQLSLMARRLLPPQYFVGMTVSQTIAVIIWINIAHRVFRAVFPPKNLLLIHGDRPIDDIESKFNSRKDKYRIVKRIPVDSVEPEELLTEIIKGYESGEYTAVVIWDTTGAQRNQILKFCYAHSIRFYIMPKITDVILMGSEELHLFDTPILLTREYCLTMEQRFFKRMIDLVCASILIVLSSPVMLATAVIIKLSDRGPALYKQVRCTLGGKEFQIMKFRSMRIDAEKDGVARLAQKQDDRITPVGKFIRKVRIDELPQLFNILKGDMSFVGPRPERPEIIAQYMEVMPEFAYRLKVKAGLAGYAQVFGKYNTTPYDKLKLDLTYIENYSLWLDFKLMLLTMKVVFMPDSTEGVESEQVTAFKQKVLSESKREE